MAKQHEAQNVHVHTGNFVITNTKTMISKLDCTNSWFTEYYRLNMGPGLRKFEKTEKEDRPWHLSGRRGMQSTTDRPQRNLFAPNDILLWLLRCLLN